MRFFNTEGPIRPDDHYHVPPLDRVNLDDLLGLVRDKRYFVLHAPRQTGKTSALLALRDLLNGGGDYRCVYVTVEAAQALREDVAEGVRTVLAELGLQASVTLGDETLEGIWPGVLERVGPGQALRQALLRWSMADPQPLVLLFDEIDALVGDTLLSVLRQLRAGYPDRPGRFPHSVILCGVRDVRDYRIYSTARKALVLGGSAFNIKSKSLRLGDFTEAETRALLAQHTAQTGQAFTADALAAVWTRTAGQPWLVNALCREACFENPAGRDRSRAISEGDILDAQERLILGRVTHLDDLADKLREDRVRRVVAPMLTGDADRGSYADRNRDVEYARDLGLLAQHDAKRIANPIYAEVIPRELTWVAQDDVEVETAWYVDAGGGLEVEKLLAAFQQFFREHSEHWTQRFDRYQEAGPQLLLQAYLQKVVNGGGRIEREYALGSGRVDLLIVWPQGDRTRRFVVECKVLHKDLERTIAEGLAQTRGYMDRCGAEAGHLIVFDRAPERTWEEKHLLHGHDDLDRRVAAFDRLIDEALAPYAEQCRLLETIPGVDHTSAGAILAEIGPDLSVFGDARRLAAWAGLCPGNNESAGKRRSGRTRHGSRTLRAVLVECAHGAARTKHCQFQKYHKALMVRCGYKRAIVATAHKLLRCIFAVLRDGTPLPRPGHRLRGAARQAQRGALAAQAAGVRHPRAQRRRHRLGVLAVSARAEDGPGALRPIRSTNALPRRSDSTTGIWGRLRVETPHRAMRIAGLFATFCRGGIRTPR